MIERLSLRLRIFLFFAFIGLDILRHHCCFSLFCPRSHWTRGNPLILCLFGGISCFAILLLNGYIWQKFDLNVANPIDMIVKDVRTLVHAGAQQDLSDAETGKYLGFLNPAIREISQRFGRSSRRNRQARLRTPLHLANRQKTPTGNSPCRISIKAF